MVGPGSSSRPPKSSGTRIKETIMDTLSITTLRGETLELPSTDLHPSPSTADYRFPQGTDIDEVKTEQSAQIRENAIHFNDPGSLKTDLPVNQREFIQAVYERPEIVFNNPHYYLYRDPFFHSGLMYLGSTKPVALGPLVESWLYTGDLSFQVPDRRYLDEQNEHPLTSFYLVNAGGSPLSGKHSAICYDPKEKSLIHFGATGSLFHLPGKLISWVEKFTSLNERFPWELRDQAPIRYRLLLDLGLN